MMEWGRKIAAEMTMGQNSTSTLYSDKIAQNRDHRPVEKFKNAVAFDSIDIIGWDLFKDNWTPVVM